ncbi:MAG: hypothetical protein HC854_10355 [Flavobacterium sp.]|nr:hypothetical protein [Flavobacterium sp.]
MAYLTAINNMANWQLENTSANDSNNGTVPDLPFNTTTFNNPVTTVAFTTEFNVVNENSASVDIILGITEPSSSSIDVMLNVSTTNGTASMVINLVLLIKRLPFLQMLQHI